MPEFLAERYEIDATPADAEAASALLANAAAGLREGGADLELLGTKFVPVDEAAYTYFRAASVELVEAAHRNAGVPYERIVESIPLTAGQDPPAATQPRQQRP